jgi:tetratricopeptide (TPR) repeat protein
MNLRGAFCLVWCATLAVTGMAILPCSRGQQPPTKSEKPATTATSATTTSTTNAETGLSGMAAFQEGLKEFRAESFGEAAKNFQTAAETQTMEVQKSHAYAWLARTELHLHNIGAAQTAAEKAVDTARDSSNAQTAMAEVYFRQGKIAEARQILIPLVKSQSGGARTYFALSKIYRITGNYKSAHELVEVAHKLDPRDPDIDVTWMWSLPRAERLAELKKRMEGADTEDKDEKAGLANRIAMMEDREKNPTRTCKLVSKWSTARRACGVRRMPSGD